MEKQIQGNQDSSLSGSGGLSTGLRFAFVKRGNRGSERVRYLLKSHSKCGSARSLSRDAAPPMAKNKNRNKQVQLAIAEQGRERPSESFKPWFPPGG